MSVNIIELKIIFGDIINGYSYIETKDLSFYIKHLNTYETCNLDKKYKEYFNEALKSDLPLENNKLKELYEEKSWTNNDDTEIKDSKNYLDGLNKTLTKLALSEQIKEIKKQIQETELKIYNLNRKREELLGLTAEKYANKRLNEYYIYSSLYKNTNFNDKVNLLYNWTDFDDLEDIELLKITNLYNKNSHNFNELNLKRISLSPFFLNLFFLTDNNPVNFYNKSILELTDYQMLIFSYGIHNKNIIQENPHIDLMEYLENPYELDEFVNRSKAAKDLMEKTKGKKGTKYVVGTSSEDTEKFGLGSQNMPDFEKLVGKDFNTAVQEGLIK